MTDRIAGFYVALEEDIRVDDAEGLMQAMMHLKGVIAVETVVSDAMSWMRKAQVRQELAQKLMDVLADKKEL